MPEMDGFAVLQAIAHGWTPVIIFVTAYDEHALRALPDIIKEFPNIVYIVLGQTHPNLLRNEGEAGFG